MAHARTRRRPHTLRSLTGLLVVGLLGTLTGGAAAAADEAADDAPTTLRVAITQGIDSFNPFLGVFSSSAEMFRAQYDTLVRYGAEDYAPEPGLATEWENSEDGLTWTFTIRDDATFTDGEPVTADDLAFTYNLMMSDPAAAEANGSFVENYASVEAPDETTLVITTTTPMPEATILANETPIVPEHVWSEVGDIGAFANDDFPLVGSGPFTVTEYRVDEFIRLEANKDYWGGAPKVDEVVFRYFKNSDAAVQALRKGDIDLLGDMTAPQFEALAGEGDIELHEGTGRRFTELTFNPGARTVAGTPIGDGHPALADPAVRYALRHAIDLDTIVDRVMNGYAEPGGGYIPPAFSQWSWQPDDDTRTQFDLAEANRLLDEAGYPRGADGIRTMPDGTRPMVMRLFGHSDRAFETPLADYITEWFAEVGITVSAEMMDSTRLNDLLADGTFDMAFSGWGVNPDPDFILSIQSCGALPEEAGAGGNSDTFYCDPEYDAMYAAQKVELDQERRVEIVREMQQRLYEQAPVITLFYPRLLEGYRSDRFGGFVRQPGDDGVTVRQQGVWGLVSAEPVSASTADETGSDTGLVLGGGLVALAAVGGVAFALTRRRAGVDDRE